jgi:hypothetical protein
MTQKGPPTHFKGRSIGTVAFVALQLLIGVIHVFFGFWLLSSEFPVAGPVSLPYDIYTIMFGVLVIVFAALFCQNKAVGWYGTVTVLIFVVIADGLTLLNLPSIPGIPKSAAVTEILYSLAVIIYLLWKKLD